jgi:hypothetical protein
MPKPKRYYTVVSKKGKVLAGDGLFDSVLIAYASKQRAKILDPEGNVVWSPAPARKKLEPPASEALDAEVMETEE